MRTPEGASGCLQYAFLLMMTGCNGFGHHVNFAISGQASSLSDPKTLAGAPAATPRVGGATSSAPNNLQGESLYARKCAVCHQPLAQSERLGATSAQIIQAMQSVPDMNILNGHLTSDEIDSIAWVLAGNHTPPTASSAQFVCAAKRPPGHSELRRLTKYELSNTLFDLLGASVAVNVMADISSLPADPVSMGFDDIDHSISSDHVNGYLKLAQHISDTVVGDSAILAMLAGNCAQQNPASDICVTDFIRNFGGKAFRRPVTATETADLLALGNDASTASSDPLEGFRMLFFYFLQSPSFLYKVETGTVLATAGDSSTYQLTAYEVAARLSYLITGTMPDSALTARAADESLLVRATQQSEINRLLADPKAALHFRHFYNQWLGLNSAASFNYSANFLAGIDAGSLASDMTRETQDYIDYIVWNQKGSFRDLMSSDLVFPRTAALASIYQVQPWLDGQSAPHAPSGRNGLLTHAALLAGGVDTGHPILRGAFLQRKMMCAILPPPKASAFAPGTLNPPTPDGSKSIRSLYVEKTAPQACQRCHSIINPMGFALSDFDNLGRHQTMEQIFDAGGNLLGSQAVDATSRAPLAPPTFQDVKGGGQLSTGMGNSPVATGCFVSQWYQYAVGRVQDDGDGCSMSNAMDALTNPSGSIQEMIRQTALSPSFTVRKLK